MANFTTCELALFLILNKQQVSENLFKKFMKDILQFYKEATLGSNTGFPHSQGSWRESGKCNIFNQKLRKVNAFSHT